MYRILCYLFLGYVPKWKILRAVELLVHEGDPNRITGKGTRYYLQCEQTGAVKSVDCK